MPGGPVVGRVTTGAITSCTTRCDMCSMRETSLVVIGIADSRERLLGGVCGVVCVHSNLLVCL